MTANSAAASLVDERARMTKAEEAMIAESLARVLARLPSEQVETVSQWTDPLVLATTLLAWLSRVVRIARENAAARAALEAPPEIQPEAAPPAIVRHRNGPRPGQPGYVPDPADFARALGGAPGYG